MNYGPATERKITEVLAACERYGKSSLIALAGVPGTGKTFSAAVAAQRFAGDPLRVREIQFHPSFSYEEFMEGMRLGEGGSVELTDGVFLEWNLQARADPDHKYVILIEELTRANLPSVLGELLTYLEYREGGRAFLTMYTRRSITLAPNLLLLATFNPADRSALELDNALLRRIRIISSPPDEGQLEDMLAGRGLDARVVEALKGVFAACKRQFPQDYEHLMPFGHGIFADVHQEQPDLYDLWEERIRHILRRPVVEPHRFTDVIEEAYPWRSPHFSLSGGRASAATGPAAPPGAMPAQEDPEPGGRAGSAEPRTVAEDPKPGNAPA